MTRRLLPAAFLLLASSASGLQAQSAAPAAPAAAAPAPFAAASASVNASAATLRDSIVALARQQIGKRYVLGGASPSRGFDCSGLVQYSYRRAGVKLPHNTDAQLRLSRPIRRAELRRGDLIFFDEKGGDNSHVGIYLGDGTFVHAPSSGKTVRRDKLDSPYWKKHLSELRRVPSS